MNVSRVFWAGIFGTVAFSGFVLMEAEGTAYPSLITIPLALFAWFLCERHGEIGLPLWASNVMGLGAFLAAGMEFLDGNEESRLLSGAHLLVYLTWIILLQRKSRGQYWFLCALSVLQISVGAVLTQQDWYGAMLLVALLLLVWTLTVFSLFRAATLFDVGKSELARSLPNRKRSDSAAKSLSAAAVDTPSSKTLAFFSQPSRAQNSIQQDRREGWINRRLVASTLVTVFGSLLLAGVVFACTPRIWLSNRPFGDISPTEAIRSMTGYSSEVKLGDIGEILESDKPVFDFRVVNNDTNIPISLLDFSKTLHGQEPYFRGSSMHIYENGEWQSGLRVGGFTPIRNRASIRKKKGLTRQEYDLHIAGDKHLFVLHPYETVGYVNRQGSPTRWTLSGTVIAPQVSAKQPVKYFVLSKPTSAEDSQFCPQNVFPKLQMQHEIGVRFYLQLPETGLARLKERAYEVAGLDPNEQRREKLMMNLIQRNGILTKIMRPPPESRQRTMVYADAKAIADRMCDYLKNSKEFTYSLDTTISDSSIDPVEDFLFNRKSGHCSYYATTLALMLRSVGIPSRLVNGFMGGHENSLTGTLEIQERHSHSWVEAQINGRWILYDPTPSRRVETGTSTTKRSMFRDIRMSLREVWSSLIVNASFTQQKEKIYDPVYNASADWLNKARESYRQRGVGGLLLNPKRWFSLQGGVLAFLVMLATVLISRLHPVRRLLQLLKNSTRRLSKTRHSNTVIVEFYDRFRRICAERDLIRTPQQTHLEFARSVTAELGQTLNDQQLTDFPRKIAAMFYQVRFGDQQLSSGELKQLQDEIAAFEKCLQPAI